MERWNQADILSDYCSDSKRSALAKLRAQRLSFLDRACWKEYFSCNEKLPTGDDLLQRTSEFRVDCEGDVVTVGRANQLTASEAKALKEVVELLIPWRKGPFSFFGEYIDSEWRSNLKWDRISAHLGSLEGKTVADIGCGNGYYMFRMVPARPKLVLGFDPSEKFFLAFELVQRFLQDPTLQYELLGVDALEFFEYFFDVVVCMGVIYHQRNPVGMLDLLYASLKPGGTVLIESQAIPGDDPVALFPPGRYAKARNVYFVPTSSCLIAWMKRAKFRDIELISVSEMTTHEQRSTEYAPFESLSDFLDPGDHTKTLEGFPAPCRVAILAKK